MHRVIRCAFVIAGLAGCCAPAQAQEDYRVLRVLSREPETNLIKAPDGSLYAISNDELYRITPQGDYEVVAPVSSFGRSYGIWGSDGAMHFGSVRVTVDGEVTHTHTFSPGAEASPVIQASDGYLYGTTGRDGKFGRGTVYRMSPTGDDDFIVLHDFTEAEQPLFAYAGPITQGSDGNFYINSPYAPTWDCCGVIYKMTPDGTVSLFHEFTQYEGWTTQSPLFLARDGALYGLTFGPGDDGVAYRLGDDGGLTILHRFNVAQLGVGYVSPGYLNQFSDGNFYFMFDEYVWRMTPTGVVTPLHRATTSAEVVRYGRPMFDLVEGVDGNYYGIASGGGGMFGRSAAGVAFRLNAVRSRCANVLEVLSDVDQNFYFTQFVKSETPASWGVWLVSGAFIKPLWITATPAITPLVGFELNLHPFPRVGPVGVLSVLVTSELKVCADWTTVDTGSDG